MRPVLVLYGRQLYGEYSEAQLWDFLSTCDREIFNGAYIYRPIPVYGHSWYRLDNTPVLLEDVPAETRALVLLLT